MESILIEEPIKKCCDDFFRIVLDNVHHPWLFGMMNTVNIAIKPESLIIPIHVGISN